MFSNNYRHLYRHGSSLQGLIRKVTMQRYALKCLTKCSVFESKTDQLSNSFLVACIIIVSFQSISATALTAVDIM